MKLKKLIKEQFKNDAEAAQSAGISVGALRMLKSRDREVMELSTGGWIVVNKKSILFDVNNFSFDSVVNIKALVDAAGGIKSLADSADTSRYCVSNWISEEREAIELENGRWLLLNDNSVIISNI